MASPLDSESCLDMDSYIYISHICIHVFFFVRAFHVHGLHICIHYTRDKKVKEETKTFIERVNHRHIGMSRS